MILKREKVKKSDYEMLNVPVASTHIPVMVNEMLAYLEPQPHQLYIDATFGTGGYSKAILEHVQDCSVIAIDRDPAAERQAADLKQQYPDRFFFYKQRFSTLDTLDVSSHSPVAGIVFDIGVSSPQIDQHERGFSFKKDGPLDMRMESQGQSAADVINTYSEQKLADIFYELGEERASRRIARLIIAERQIQPFTTTKQLANLVHRVVRPSRDKLDPATRTFQALRLYINDELNELSLGLNAGHKLLKNDGRLVVISFHSLEDRIVKQFFKQMSCVQEPVSRHRPEIPTQQKSLKILTKKAIFPTDDEIKFNYRARSARLRAAVKTLQ